MMASMYVIVISMVAVKMRKQKRTLVIVMPISLYNYLILEPLQMIPLFLL